MEVAVKRTLSPHSDTTALSHLNRINKKQGFPN